MPRHVATGTSAIGVAADRPVPSAMTEGKRVPQLGPAEILVILLVGLLVFGPKRLPEVGRQVGRALHEAKRFQARISDEIDSVVRVHDEPASVGAPGSTPED